MGISCSVEDCGHELDARVQLSCDHYLCMHHALGRAAEGIETEGVLRCGKCGCRRTIKKRWLKCGCEFGGCEGLEASTQTEDDCIKRIKFRCKNGHDLEAEDIHIYSICRLVCTHLVSRFARGDAKKIDFDLNHIGTEGAKGLAAALEKGHCLTSIDLRRNNIGAEGGKRLAAGLENSTTIVSLDLWENNIGSDGAKALGKVLEKTKTLTNLVLRDNDIGPEGAKGLASALEVNSTLTSLNLRRNQIGPEGAKCLAAALSKNFRLASLYLYGNGIGPEGAKCIAAALEENIALAKLDIGNNDIGAEGAKGLAVTLTKNLALTLLDPRENAIGTEGAKKFAEALIVNTTLLSLDLYGNKIDPEGAKALAAALEKNQTLISLDLGYNSIKPEGANAIAAALEKNTTITSINLWYNDIEPQGKPVLASIATMLSRNKTGSKTKAGQAERKLSPASPTMSLSPRSLSPRSMSPAVSMGSGSGSVPAKEEQKKLPVPSEVGGVKVPAGEPVPEPMISTLILEKDGKKPTAITRLPFRNRNSFLVEYSDGQRKLLKIYNFADTDKPSIDRARNEYEFSVNIGNATPYVAKGLFTEELAKDGRIFIEHLFEWAGDTVLEKLPASPAKILEWAKQSATGCSAAEKLGIYHTNLKPEYLVISSDNMLKVVDFSDAAKAQSKVTREVLVKARDKTKCYYPPELLMGGPGTEISYAKIDVYCWGMIFYRLISGKSAAELWGECLQFKWAQAKYGLFLRKVELMQLYGEKGAELKKGIVKILYAALAYDPKNRSSFAELLQMLEQIKVQLEVGSLLKSR